MWQFCAPKASEHRDKNEDPKYCCMRRKGLWALRSGLQGLLQRNWPNLTESMVPSPWSGKHLEISDRCIDLWHVCICVCLCACLSVLWKLDGFHWISTSWASHNCLNCGNSKIQKELRSTAFTSRTQPKTSLSWVGSYRLALPSLTPLFSPTECFHLNPSYSYN